MAHITLASRDNNIDGSIKAKVFTFLEKLQVSDETLGLRIKPLRNSADSRVRTGRVDDNYRAVLYRLDSEFERHYVYYGTYKHDVAIDVALTTVLEFNTALGTPVFRKEQERKRKKQDREREHVARAKQRVVEQKPEPEAWVNILVEQGYDVDTLVGWGIDEVTADEALAADSEDMFYAAVESTSDTAGLILIELNAGKSIQQVREELGITPVEKVEDETKEIVEALKKPSLDYVHVGDDPKALAEAIESMSIDRWRVFLHPEQRRYAEGSWNGAYRLSGGAGTGKTVVLLHRARHLHRQNPEARILLTTFTTTLANSLEQNLLRLDPELPIVDLGEPGIAVVGVDKLSNHIVSAANEEVREEATRAVLGEATKYSKRRVTREGNLWRDAEMFAGTGDLRQELTNPDFLAAEYQTVVLPNRLTRENQYLRVARQGRGTPLNRRARKDVWKIIAQFRRTNELDGKLTFEEVVAIAADVLKTTGGIVDHVLVDEGQDFHALHWQLLRGLVDEGPNDLFIAEDSHQRIYGHRITLSHYGINIRGRARRLTLNYRTTAENLAYAMRILEGAEVRDLEDGEESTEYYASLRNGPKPVIVDAASEHEELEAVRDRIGAWTGAGYEREGIGILTRTNTRAQSIAADLKLHDIDATYVSRDQMVGDGNVAVMTMHAAKGMEFSCVVVVGAGKDQIPAGFEIDNLPEAERDDALLRERSLLYVAATRARDELMITRTAESAF